MLKQFRLFFWLSLCLVCSVKQVKAQLIISEVYPNPNDQETEWVELYNPSDETIDLDSWQLWDQLSKPSNIYTFTSGEQLTSLAYLVVELKSVLNNSGDTVILYDQNQVVQDSLTYTSSTKGLSWAKNSNNPTTIFETSPNPGFDNPIASPSPLPTTKLTPIPTQLPPPDSFPTTSQPSHQHQVQVTSSGSDSPTNFELPNSNLYPPTVLKPQVNLPKQETRQLQSIYFESPNLEIGAINVIIGATLLLIPGLIYAKKQEFF
ncbi:MAG: lamin tail domain-containing protein [Candidatus Pacebacteria bacterium]|nr:lamin tail domain-containing protein [Candidatus Paceibacterota bacterium]